MKHRRCVRSRNVTDVEQSKHRRCEGEAKRHWRGGRRSVADAEEGEVSLMWRNWSVANSEKSKRHRCSNHCDLFLSATDAEKLKRHRCLDHCDSFLSMMIQMGYRWWFRRRFWRWFRFYRQWLSTIDWVLKNCRLVSFGIRVGLVLLGTNGFGSFWNKGLKA